MIEAPDGLSLDAVVFIYTLCHPDTREVRYVGRTFDVRQRFVSHCGDGHNRELSAWIEELSREAKEPLMVVVARVVGLADACIREKSEIRKHSPASLFNYKPSRNTLTGVRKTYGFNVEGQVKETGPSKRLEVAKKIADGVCLQCDLPMRSRGLCARHYQQLRILMWETEPFKRPSVERSMIRDGILLAKRQGKRLRITR